jgi:ABC-type molybdate transport system substrate-binding protein
MCRKVFLYVFPFVALIGLFFAVRAFLLSDAGSPSRSSRRPMYIIVWCDEALRNPAQAPDMGHEAGALGRFERRYGVRVDVRYGNPVDLLEAAGEGDVLMLGDPFYIDKAQEAGLTARSPETIAWLVPVILTRSGNPLGIETVSDLANPDIRLAAAAPDTGLIRRMTSDVLADHDLQLDVLDQVHFLGKTTTEVARAVLHNRVDAAIVWRPSAMQYGRQVELIEISGSHQYAAPVQAAVLMSSPNPEAAAQLVRFLASGASARIFELYGFDYELNKQGDL